MKYIELFAGIGGFRYGLERVDNVERIEIAQQDNVTPEGSSNNSSISIQERRQSAFTCVYANEWGAKEQKREWLKTHDPETDTFSPSYAHRIYRRHYGEIDTRDIRNVSRIPDFDLLTAGFPCQAFSVAGKRLGFEDTRGTLFFEIARILKSKRPRHFLLENVKGLLSHESGQTINTIRRILSDLGYRIEWMVLNSKHFGVPQNRERVFIIGHLREGRRCTGEVFPIRQENGGADGEIVSTAIDRNYWKGVDNHGQRTMIIHNKLGMDFVGGVGKPKRIDDGKEFSRNFNQGNRVYNSKGITAALSAEPVGGSGGHTGLYAMRGRNPDNPSDRKTGSPTEQRLELNTEGITNALTSVAKDNLWLENSRIRKLTPTTCERLQGFPDRFTKFGMLEDGKVIEIADTQRYKCLGNAVTTTVITAIGTELYNHLQENE